MALSARLPLAVDRYGAAVRTVLIRGLDLTGVTMRAQVRLLPDTPDEPLIDLGMGANTSAEGLYLVSAAADDTGAMVSTVQIRINETTLEGLPYAGELGDNSTFAWDWQATIGGDKRRLAYGDFVVLAGVTGADNAPSGRTASYAPSSSAAAWSTAELTFGPNTVAITIDGADVVSQWAGVAKTYAAEAGEARDEVKDSVKRDPGRASLQLIGSDDESIIFELTADDVDYVHDEIAAGAAIETVPGPDVIRIVGADGTLIDTLPLPASGDAGASATWQDILPNDPRIADSDYAAIAEASPFRKRFVRPIYSSARFQFASPGTRSRLLTDSTKISLQLAYTNMVTRDDAENGVAGILVNGVPFTTITPATPSTAAGVEEHEADFGSAEPREVTLVLPYATSVDQQRWRVLAGAAVAAPPNARPTGRLFVIGDSISEGFWAASVLDTWAWRVADAHGLQLVNLANGGALAAASDADALTALAPTADDRIIVFYGYNHFGAQQPLAAFEAVLEALFAAIRTKAPATPVYVQSMIWTPNTDTITPADYRASTRNAFDAWGDGNATFVDGLTLMTNDASRLQDGVHPNLAGSDDIVEGWRLILPGRPTPLFTARRDIQFVGDSLATPALGPPDEVAALYPDRIVATDTAIGGVHATETAARLNGATGAALTGTVTGGSIPADTSAVTVTSLAPNVFRVTYAATTAYRAMVGGVEVVLSSTDSGATVELARRKAGDAVAVAANAPITITSGFVADTTDITAATALDLICQRTLILRVGHNDIYNKIINALAVDGAYDRQTLFDAICATFDAQTSWAPRGLVSTITAGLSWLTQARVDAILTAEGKAAGSITGMAASDAVSQAGLVEREAIRGMLLDRYGDRVLDWMGYWQGLGRTYTVTLGGVDYAITNADTAIDGTHCGVAGHALEAAFIKQNLDRKGW